MEWTDNDIRMDSPLFVSELQSYLRALAFYDTRLPLINVDGIFGDETADAVRAFQAAYGLPVTGEVDYPTWIAITAAYDTLRKRNTVPLSVETFPSSAAVLRAGDRGDVVTILQVMLNSLARRFSNLLETPATGVYDEQTADAVRELQKRHRLPDTGEVDIDTWNALTNTYNRHLSKRFALTT